MAALNFLKHVKLVSYVVYTVLAVAFAFHVVFHATQREEAPQMPSYPSDPGSATVLPLSVPFAEALRYVPAATVRAWGERDFLLVFGIPSVDIEGRRRRRYLQRTTCWQFPGVATRANGYAGEMLVLYVLARHPSQNYTYSAALQEEAAHWHDVVTLPMNEGRPTTNKKIGGKGYWGAEAEIGLSRKVFLWFELALRLFPTASYVGKGDDDMFLRVPQYLADLRTLPRRKVYWGEIYSKWGADEGRYLKYRFALGPCYTLGKDAVEVIVSYKPLRRLVALPYTKEREPEFVSFFNSEDMMVGFVLRKSNYHTKLQYFAELRCAFHDVHEGNRVERVRRTSVMVHHLRENEYNELVVFFKGTNNTNPRRKRHIHKNHWELRCA